MKTRAEINTSVRADLANHTPSATEAEIKAAVEVEVKAENARRTAASQPTIQ